jgi:hypothetical protein
MPRGPKGEKRPADVVGNAVHVTRTPLVRLLGPIHAIREFVDMGLAAFPYV